MKASPEIFNINELPLPPSLEVKREDCPSLVNLKLEFPSHLGYRVYDGFSSEEIEKTKDGNYVVTTSFPHDKWVYSFLLSFGSDVKVLEPEEIRINLLNEIEKIKKFINSNMTRSCQVSNATMKYLKHTGGINNGREILSKLWNAYGKYWRILWD